MPRSSNISESVNIDDNIINNDAEVKQIEEEENSDVLQWGKTLLAFFFIFASIVCFFSYSQQQFINELIQRENDCSKSKKEKQPVEEKSFLAEITDNETFKGTKEVLELIESFLNMIKTIIENFS